MYIPHTPYKQRGVNILLLLQKETKRPAFKVEIGQALNAKPRSLNADHVDYSPEKG